MGVLYYWLDLCSILVTFLKFFVFQQQETLGGFEQDPVFPRSTSDQFQQKIEF